MTADASEGIDLTVEADWPRGLCCGECGRPFEDGERYAKQLEAMCGAVPMLISVCLPCDLPGLFSEGWLP